MKHDMNVPKNGTKERIQFTENHLKEKWKLVPEFLAVRGLVKEHIISYSHFLDFEIKSVVKANCLVTTDVDCNWYLKYLDVRVGYPCVDDTFQVSNPITPHECRLRDMSYTAPVLVDVEYIRGGAVVERKNVLIGKIPVMLRSSHCALYNKKEEELIPLDECPMDPGGYFIVRGVERVLLMQEQLMNNRMLLDREPDGTFCCSAVSSTSYIKSRTAVYMKGDKFFLKHSSFIEDIPVMIIFKGMRIETDQEVAQLIGVEDDVLTMFSPSIESCHQLGVFTSEQALKYLGARVKHKTTGKRYDNSSSEARELLLRMVLAHVPVIHHNFLAKGCFLALMIRRIILATLGHIKEDDRDYYGNKRVELAGSLISLLFEDLFKRFNYELKRTAEKCIHLPKAEKFDVLNHFRADIITLGLTNAIGTGNWTIRRFNMHRVGVTQVLSRLSYISALGMMTRINSLFEKTRKVSGPRSLQPSQWGVICPTDTPEGEGCGLVKNFALLSLVTSGVDDTLIKTLLYNLGVESIYIISGEEFCRSDTYSIFVNGSLLGVIKNHTNLISTLRNLRRSRQINEHISISSHRRLRYIHIATDGGRLCRPCIIVKDGIPCVSEEDLEKLSKKEIDFDYFIQSGKIEYLDINEENDALIAIQMSDIVPETTHLEIAAFAILGVVSGLVPFPHHNQSPRNTYQCAMGKQAMGSIAYNQHKRMDTLLYLLTYPQVPLVKSKTLDIVKFNNLPAGQNAMVAVMSYSGYDIEDALIINKASLDRGIGRCLVYRKSQISLRNYPNQTYDRIMGPYVDCTTKEPIWRHRALDVDGICSPGVLVENKQVLVNKSVPFNSGSSFQFKDPKRPEAPEYKDSPLCYKGSLPSYADKVLLTSNQEEPCIVKILLRQSRRPELGDKFSSRHGQKGVVGMISKQEDMPFNEDGICPDFIMNPHGFPSRMTVGKLIELITGKAGLITGKLSYSTAFEDAKVDQVCRTLEAHGFSSHGKDLLMSGITGELIPVYIYMGPVYYQKLKHMVLDKMHARARGPRAVLTRQPTEGRSREGGLRLGEMERDCLIGYGASMLVMERLMLSSDVFHVEICEVCGLLAHLGWCQYCKSSSRITTLQMPYACKLLIQELQSMNVVPRLKLQNYIK